VLGLVTVPTGWLSDSSRRRLPGFALENLALRHVPSRRWVVSFLFGSCTAAACLGTAPLALPPWNLALALLGFHLGVRLAQGMVIAVLLPC